ncbi:NADPH2:quinone reductase [Nocardioides luteus]|uniref:Oxidoreductase n=1 Tax=Nocardioides luteus TaxID=1844 RepID=A0ABQ5SX10_9ACTN|nr:zinc-binding dehydrogenase [Nocardioides luteus]MDR7311767.1 NADPH2:quinone reductase [Nocardioides luteus]GGR66084.1 oxidoreductase [Nocardioides luteus]GLJ68009.1 oxidoreductase [Nocardioides luteus]
MRAIRQHEFGGPQVLRLEEVPDPTPGPGQVRIRVEAAGIHRLDTSIRAADLPPTMPRPELPMTPGREVAGVVDEVGDGVDRTWRGAAVVAHLGPGSSGGYAELAVVEEAKLYRRPDGLESADAVAAIGTGRTSAAVLEAAEITPDDVVVVTSAAGGMGAILLQGIRNAGARAIGLAGSPAKLEIARRFGAQTAIDYRRDGWLQALREQEPRITVLLDGVGGDVPRQVHGLLEPDGRMVRFSGDQDGYEGAAKIVDILGPFVQGRIKEFEQAALAAAADGTRTPYVGSRFPLERAAEAHAALENRETTGKVVLVAG